MRLVCLCPSLTELIYDLDRGNDLVGITRYCVHPRDRVALVEKVGGTKDPILERILELEPDLVLLNKEENRLEDAEALVQAGVDCLTTDPKTISETAEMVRMVGRNLDRVESAEAIARDIEERARRIALERRNRGEVRWTYLIWRKPWMTVNRQTFIHSLLEHAGGHNVFADQSERYPAISTEALIAADPEVVLLATEPFPFATQHIEELMTLTGWARSRFRIVDGELLSWHGSRTPAGLDYANSVIREVSIFSDEMTAKPVLHSQSADP